MMSPSAEMLLTVMSEVILMAGSLMAWGGISPMFKSMATFIVMTAVCLSPGLGCSRSSFRGSAPASISFT